MRCHVRCAVLSEAKQSGKPLDYDSNFGPSTNPNKSLDLLSCFSRSPCSLTLVENAEQCGGGSLVVSKRDAHTPRAHRNTPRGLPPSSNARTQHQHPPPAHPLSGYPSRKEQTRQGQRRNNTREKAISPTRCTLHAILSHFFNHDMAEV